MTPTTYPDNWQPRVEFCGAKWEGYKKRSPQSLAHETDSEAVGAEVQ